MTLFHPMCRNNRIAVGIYRKKAPIRLHIPVFSFPRNQRMGRSNFFHTPRNRIFSLQGQIFLNPLLSHLGGMQLPQMGKQLPGIFFSLRPADSLSLSAFEKTQPQ